MKCDMKKSGSKKAMPAMKKGGMAKKSSKKGGMPEMMLAKFGRNIAKAKTQK
jgi:hypothetical protein